MKINYLILASILAIIMMSGCNKYAPQSDIVPTKLTEFMLGKWQTTTDHLNENEPYQEDFFVKFGSEHKLLFCHKVPHDSFCDNYTYAQINSNEFSVESKRALGGKWQISEKDENLEICFQDDSDSCLEFIRDTSGYDVFLELFHFYW